MKHTYKNMIGILVLSLSFSCSGQDADSAGDDKDQKSALAGGDTTAPLITFVELGSVNCIPCKMMQPVMAAIEKKYGEQIRVVFYDVWKTDQKKYAQEYGIQLIPTQVFLDKDGKEIFRHEGFFPEEDIDTFLQKQGLKPIQK